MVKMIILFRNDILILSQNAFPLLKYLASQKKNIFSSDHHSKYYHHFQVSQRVLPPRRKYSTPQELLMESIRSDSARNNLRKTSGPPETPLLSKYIHLNDVLKPVFPTCAQNEKSTVCKFQYFSVTQILPEINFGVSRSSKDAIFAISLALNLTNLLNSSM